MTPVEFTVTQFEPRFQSSEMAARPPWNPVLRLGFRFSFVYFILYSLPFPLSLIPGLGIVDQLWVQAWLVPVRWVGAAGFGVDIMVLPSGSGDTTFNYVQVLCMLVLAAVAAAIWSALDHRRPRYDRLHEWLRVYLRYVLAFAMILYGMSKVFMLQFTPPDPGRLTQTYGESSPMGLLWTFMGASVPYTFFAGLMEVVGGLLLVPRRTVTLGALVVAGVMTNVVMLNFCYDVPVKLYSSHLLLMAIVLALPDVGRLMNVLVLHRGVAAAPVRPLFGRRWIDWPLIGVKVAVVLELLAQQAAEGFAEDARFGGDEPKPALYGVYRAEAFTRAGEARPMLVTDGSLWHTLSFNRYGAARLVTMDASITRLRVAIDEAKGSVTLTPWQQEDQTPITLSFSKPDPEHLVLEGEYRGEPIRVGFRRKPEEEFLLISRGFRWITEHSFNR